jgi:FkbM family methyltransferase
MSVSGAKRYQHLFKNVSNWQEYIFRKGSRKNRPLKFTTKPHAITFEVPDSLYQVFKEIFMEDFYEIDDLVKKLPKQPVIIDVGANAGFFNILIHSKIPEARIFSYEPMPANIELFKKSIADNALLQKIALHQKAVTGSEKGSIDLFTADTEDNTVVSSVYPSFHGLNNKKISVAAESLTSIITNNDLSTVDLLKLDCEGSEYDILYNTNALALAKVRMMVIEVHQLDDKQNNIEQLDKYLQSIGYTTRYSPVQEGCYYMEAIR